MPSRVAREKLSTVKQPAVYTLAGARTGTIRVGVTSDHVRRVRQRREGVTDGSPSRYDCKTLAYFELLHDVPAASQREKQKAGSRQRKLALTDAGNPTWRDLYGEIL